MKKFIKTFLAVCAASLLISGPAVSAPIESLDTIHVKTGKVGMRADSLELRSSGSTKLFTLTPAASLSADRAITLPDPGAAASFVMTAGAQTIAGVKTFSSAPVFSSPPTKASLGKQAKRVILCKAINGGGTLADSTTYRGFLFPGRAGTVTNVVLLAGTVPIGGTNAVKILKASSAGNTMLSAATFDPTTLTNNTGAPMTLTATSADLGLTATQGVYIEWATGVQTTDAINATVSVEFEPDDY